MSRKTIVVLYYTRGVYPLRDTIRTHLYCWQRYSRHRVFCINVAYCDPEPLLRDIHVDVAIFHTTFLASRWHEPIWDRFTARGGILRSRDCLKIAMPQDEFMRTDLLGRFIDDFGVDWVFTCADESDWPEIYRDVDRDRVNLRTVLTGYLDDATVARIDRRKGRGGPRPIDIGYRAWRAEYWLGEHGLHKVRVADETGAAAARLGLRTDISLAAEDTLHGDDWLDFLLRCRATVGVEGGASVLDRDGSIRARVNAYVKDHPAASFTEVREACFPAEDHRIGLACISPRHLEACATETCQILIEGTFNGILEAGRHYLPLRADYADVDEVVARLRDEETTRRIARAAYDDVVASGRWSYRRFVEDIERAIIDPDERPAAGRRLGAAGLLRRRWRDKLSWALIRIEVYLIKGGPIRGRVYDRFLRMVKDLV